MKKTLLILYVVLVFVFGSCSNEFDDITYTITNESSKTVGFSLNDIQISLAGNESVIYVINSEKGIFAPENIIIMEHPRSINLEKLNKGTSGIFFVFSDNIPFALNVENKLSIPVTVKAGNFIEATDDTDVDAYDVTEFALKIKENSIENASIYTSTPSFYVKESDESERTLDPEETGFFIPYPYPHPITVAWELSNGTIKVVIK
jgi:hypothetical protein